MKSCLCTLIVFAFLLTLSLDALGFFSTSQKAFPELVLQTGHSKAVQAIVMGSDKRWIASASFDSTIRMWSLESGRELRAITGHVGAVNALACSPDGTLLASGGSDRTIRVWSIATGAQIGQFDAIDLITAVTFAPDGKLIAFAGLSGTITVRDIATGQNSAQFVGHTGVVRALAYNPTGSILASAGDDKTVRLWETANGKSRILKAHMDCVRVLAFSPDGTFLVSGSDDKAIKLWNPINGRPLATLLGHTASIAAVSIPSAARITSLDLDGEIRQWNPDGRMGWKLAKSDKLDAADGSTATFSTDGNILAVGKGDGSIAVIDPNTKLSIATLENHTVGYSDVKISHDGHWLAAAGFDNTVKLWDLTTGDNRPALRGHTGQVTAVSFTRDNRIVSASLDHTLRVWDPVSRRCIAVLKGHSNTISGLGVGKYRFAVSSSTDETIGIWDLEGKEPPRFLKGHKGEVVNVALSPDESSIASAGVDGTIRLWDTKTGNALPVLYSAASEVDAVAFSPDGKFLAAGGLDCLIRIFEVEGGRLLQTLSGHTGKVNSVSFSPEGLRIVSGAQDKTVRIWNVADKAEVRKVQGHAGAVFAASFSPDGRFVVSASEDGSIVLSGGANGERAATLLSLRGADDWLVVTPQGFFDGSPGSWQQLSWRFDNNTFSSQPVEIFFNEYYLPGLLSDVFGRVDLPSITAIGVKDRRQPELKLALAEAPIETSSSSTRIKVTVTIGAASAGARDLRIFRNGSLVKVWSGDVMKGQTAARLEATFPLVAGDNRITAYAFNNDNIKSSDAVLKVRGSDKSARKGTLYVLAVGVDQYSNSEFNLSYAVSDSHDFCEEMKRQQTAIGRFGRIETVELLNKEAQKGRILAALRDLTTKVEPEDGVIIYFAGHGIALQNRFYLVPHDLGYIGSRRYVKDLGLSTIVSHSLSDEELESAVRDIDSDYMLLVIDACDSGQVLETDEKRRGPMNSKGLAQIAYDKGMYILTASQSNQAAQEAVKLGHGFLTFALVEEGLKTNAADQEPKDGDVTLREWLDYATIRVPQIQQDDLRARELVRDKPDGRSHLNEQSIQRPRAFYRREPEQYVFVVARHR